MPFRTSLLLAALVLAGCISGPIDSGTTPAPPVATPTYSCQASAQVPEPCFDDVAALGGSPVALAVHPNDQARMSAVLPLAEGQGPESVRLGIAVSEDGGKTWVHQPLQGGDELMPPGVLAYGLDVAWTRAGAILVAAVLERAPAPTRVLDLRYPVDRDFWVGASTDLGLTWTTSILDARDPLDASLAAWSDDQVVVAWSDQDLVAHVTWSADAGQTWVPERDIAGCAYPARAVDWRGDIAVGCQNTGIAPDQDTKAVLIHRDGGGSTFSVLADAGCTSRGLAVAGDLLVVALACGDSWRLVASSDGSSWTRWGEAPSPPSPGAESSFALALQATPEGTVVGVVQRNFYTPDGPFSCGCHAEVRLYAWSSDGGLATDAFLFDRTWPDDPAAIGPFSVLAAASGGKLAFLQQDDLRLGWAQASMQQPSPATA